MMPLVYSLFIPLMSFISRVAGGLFPRLEAIKPLRRLPEILFSLPFGYAGYTLLGPWGLLGAVISFFAMEMGHGTFYNMDGYQDHNRDPGQTKPRVQTIEKFVRLFYRGDITKPLYSWVCMGVKGLLIGLPAFPFGLGLAILWPLSYWISRKVIKDKASAEWISGGFAGLVVALALVF